MSQAQDIAETYVAAWNEADPVRRLALLTQGWAEDAVYGDPLGRAAGHAEIAGLIGAVQARFPGFRFALKGPADGYGEAVRFSWVLGPDGAEPPIEGSDVVIVDDGRIARVIGFLDKVPQAA